jgi:hypothetical protein
MKKKSKSQKRRIKAQEEATPKKVKLKAKANWQLPERLVKAGEIIQMDKTRADILLKKTSNFSII